MMIAVGVLLVTGLWDQVVTWAAGPAGGVQRGGRLSCEHPRRPASPPVADPEPRHARRAGPRELAALVLAPAHLDAHRADAAAPAGAGRHPRLGRPAARRRLARPSPLAGRAPRLTPVFERLGLFSVYDSPWFSAIYILLMVSLVGCILPRSLVYWRALRARRPTPRAGLTRLPDHASYDLDDEPARRPRARAATELRTAPLPASRSRRRGCGRRRSGATCARPATCSSTCRCWWCWSASRSAACSATRAA